MGNKNRHRTVQVNRKQPTRCQQTGCKNTAKAGEKYCRICEQKNPFEVNGLPSRENSVAWRLEEFADLRDDLEWETEQEDLKMHVVYDSLGFPHVTFLRGNQRVLEWWPSSLTWKSHITGEEGKVDLPNVHGLACRYSRIAENREASESEDADQRRHLEEIGRE